MLKFGSNENNTTGTITGQGLRPMSWIWLHVIQMTDLEGNFFLKTSTYYSQTN